MKTVSGMNTAAHLRLASEPVASAGIRNDRQRPSDLISVVYDAGATRQADLVKLVAGYAAPLAG
jgi:hypothetical protein